MKTRGPEPAVEVMVNGKGPYLFAIDTGGSGDARADVSLVKGLGLETIGEARGSAGGAVQIMPIVLVNTIRIGDVTLANVSAPSRDYNAAPGLPRIDGILGCQAFDDFLLTLDFPAKRVRLTRGDLPPADGRTVLDADFSRRIPTISIDVAGRTVAADLDTGNVAGDQLVLPAALAASLPLAAPPTPAGAVTTISGSARAQTADLSGTVTIGGETLSHPRVVFLDGARAANIGAGLLQHYVVTIDQKNKRVKLERAGG